MEFFKKYKEAILFMLAYWFICILMFFKEINFLYLILSWNVLLAVLPLFFINKSQLSIMQGKVRHCIIWMIFWLFFFPNSVYMVTDFIHISGDNFRWLVEVDKYSLDSGIVYGNDILIWIKLLIIGIGFLFSLLVGLESFYIFEQNIKATTSKYLSFCVMIVASLLSGIGVYIGRFLRFNSWDILLDPIQLLKELLIGINSFTIYFITAFTIFIIASYILYKILRKMVSC